MAGAEISAGGDATGGVTTGVGVRIALVVTTGDALGDGTTLVADTPVGGGGVEVAVAAAAPNGDRR